MDHYLSLVADADRLTAEAATARDAAAAYGAALRAAEPLVWGRAETEKRLREEYDCAQCALNSTPIDDRPEYRRVCKALRTARDAYDEFIDPGITQRRAVEKAAQKAAAEKDAEFWRLSPTERNAWYALRMAAR